MDTRKWAYDFERDLPAGVRCSFTLRPDLTSLSGNPVAVATFSFSTGGPAVLSTEPWTGGEVDEEQAFVLFVDAEPTLASVLEHVWFSVDSFPERIGARLVEGAERDAIVATLDASQRTQPMVIVQARQRFPSGATVILNWGQGIAGHSGVTTSSTQPFPFEVRKPFTATFSCLRENAKADCIPVSPFRLTFSAAVPRALVRSDAFPLTVKTSPSPPWRSSLPASASLNPKPSRCCR